MRRVLKCCPGKFLAAVFSKGVRNYGFRVDQGGCGASINSARTEEIVFDALLPLADSPALKDVIHTEETADQEEAQRLVAENAEDESKIDEMADMVADGEMGRATFTKQNRRLTSRITQRLDRLSELRGQSALNRLGGNVRKDWDSMSADDKRLVMLSLCDHIVVAKGTKGRFDADRLKIMYRFAAIAKVAKAEGKVSIPQGVVRIVLPGVRAVDLDERPPLENE